ncbi:type IV pilin protein [Paraburkholderia sp. GAS334]|uniref:type IV pilin protein n=1 Tax=Paraburkholderia sp. GAS334 TaxID=3035131 RepID=UPI003D206518
MNSGATAFTLLELVIAIAIAATLAVFAVPSWHAQVARSHRVDAASSLYRAAQFPETATGKDAGTLPAGLDQAPPFGSPVYRLRVLGGDDTNGGYSVEARPVESGPMRDDACGTFVIEATGLRRNQNAGDTAVANTNECWNTR